MIKERKKNNFSTKLHTVCIPQGEGSSCVTRRSLISTESYEITPGDERQREANDFANFSLKAVHVGSLQI